MQKNKKSFAEQFFEIKNVPQQNLFGADEIFIYALPYRLIFKKMFCILNEIGVFVGEFFVIKFNEAEFIILDF